MGYKIWGQKLLLIIINNMLHNFKTKIENDFCSVCKSFINPFLDKLTY